MELITLIYRANSRIDKVVTLQTARDHAEAIRLLVWLTKEAPALHSAHQKRGIEGICGDVGNAVKGSIGRFLWVPQGVRVSGFGVG